MAMRFFEGFAWLKSGFYNAKWFPNHKQKCVDSISWPLKRVILQNASKRISLYQQIYFRSFSFFLVY